MSTVDEQGGIMNIHSFSVAALCTMLLFANPLRAEQAASAAGALQPFHDAVSDYAKLHRRLEKQVRQLHVTEHAEEIFDASDALANAIKAARPTAREGDLFTPAVANVFRERIADALTAGGFHPEEVIAASLEEADEEAPLPVVNGRFPWLRGAAMWPCVLNALPLLPDDLEYRIVGRDLVMVDTHANLVVDILRNAVR
jgi:hypothetical protein